MMHPTLGKPSWNSLILSWSELKLTFHISGPHSVKKENRGRGFPVEVDALKDEDECCLIELHI